MPRAGQTEEQRGTDGGTARDRWRDSEGQPAHPGLLQSVGAPEGSWQPRRRHRDRQPCATPRKSCARPSTPHQAGQGIPKSPLEAASGGKARQRASLAPARRGPRRSRRTRGVGTRWGRYPVESSSRTPSPVTAGAAGAGGRSLFKAMYVNVSKSFYGRPLFPP